MFGKTTVLKVLKNSLKNVLSNVPSKQSTCPIHPSITILKLTTLQMLPMSVPRIFKVVGRASLMDTLFSTVTGEISAFFNIAKMSNSCFSIFRKLALLENSEKSPFNRSCMQAYSQQFIALLKAKSLQNLLKAL